MRGPPSSADLVDQARAAEKSMATAEKHAASAGVPRGYKPPDRPARAGDVVPCLVCSGKGYVYSLHHVVCRECKGTRTVIVEVYR